MRIEPLSTLRIFYPHLLVTACLSIGALTAAEPDLRAGESAGAAARPFAGLFAGSEDDQFRKAVAKIDSLEVYEGLPDPRTQPGAFARESAREDIRQVGGSFFYTTPLKIDAKALAELRAAFHPGDPFAGGGGEACGAFHADFLIEWKSDKTIFSALIGLGCQEIQAFGPEINLHRYIPPPVYAQLNRVLGRLGADE